MLIHESRDLLSELFLEDGENFTHISACLVQKFAFNMIMLATMTVWPLVLSTSATLGRHNMAPGLVIV